MCALYGQNTANPIPTATVMVGQPANDAMGGGLNADDAGYGWALNDQQATDYGGMGATGLRR